MAILIYLKSIFLSEELKQILATLEKETIYLAGSVETVDVIEDVSNDKINFPKIPPHIFKENNQRAKMLDQLNELADEIEKSTQLRVIATLVDSDLDELSTKIEQNDLKISRIIKIE